MRKDVINIAARGASSRLTSSRAILFVLLVTVGLGGCARGPALVPEGQRKAIDRAVVEYPAGFEFTPFVESLSAPTAIAFGEHGSILIADGGFENGDPT